MFCEVLCALCDRLQISAQVCPCYKKNAIKYSSEIEIIEDQAQEKR